MSTLKSYRDYDKMTYRVKWKHKKRVTNATGKQGQERYREGDMS